MLSVVETTVTDQNKLNMTINAPIGWWVEFQAASIGTINVYEDLAIRTREKKFTIADFSVKNLLSVVDPNRRIADIPRVDFSPYLNGTNLWDSLGMLAQTVDLLNRTRDLYLETEDAAYLQQCVLLLPMSYNTTNSVSFNKTEVEKIQSICDNSMCYSEEWLALLDKAVATLGLKVEPAKKTRAKRKISAKTEIPMEEKPKRTTRKKKAVE